MILSLLNLELMVELDVVLARQRARQIASLLGFDQLDQTRIATATSEIARNAIQYSGGGRAEFLIESTPQPSLLITVRQRGPGIKDLQTILDGQSAVQTGLGIGGIGARRLMDRFAIESTPNAAGLVSMSKNLPNRTLALTTRELARISAELAKQTPQGLLEELQQQNQELLETLRQLRESQAELAQVNSRELDATNRGVVALYAELEEGTKTLQRLSDLKSRFLSEMSHELRSPLNSIRSLTGFLLARTDGELTDEQEKQVGFIRQAADGLSTLVNDLLDLAKVAAGKAVIRSEWFDVTHLLDGLQGTIRPMVAHDQVTLLFEKPVEVFSMLSDAGKVEQILRNFLTNAIKFTERGRIVVRTIRGPGDHVIFSVSDTGIGIATADLDRIFEEYGQLENPLQTQVKGTGLGLPLARKLAQLLGGDVSVESEPAIGSTFLVSIPRLFQAKHEPEPSGETRPEDDPKRATVIMIANGSSELAIQRKAFEGTECDVVLADSVHDARQAMYDRRPSALIIDLSDDFESTASLLVELKSSPGTREIVVLAVSDSDQRLRALELGADDFCMKPIPPQWARERLDAIEAIKAPLTALIVDDRERDRYLISQALAAIGRFRILEADRGETALQLAFSEKPDVIFLDLTLPDLAGQEILDRLRTAGATQHIPVVINTSEVLPDDKRDRLRANVVAILSKGKESRNAVIAEIRGSLIKAGLCLPVSQRAKHH